MLRFTRRDKFMAFGCICSIPVLEICNYFIEPQMPQWDIFGGALVGICVSKVIGGIIDMIAYYRLTKRN